MPKIPAIAVAGHICLDVIPTFPQNLKGDGVALTPGRLINIGPALRSTGGTVPNTGIALHRLGFPVHLIAKVGDDPFGQEIRNLVQQHGKSLAAGIVVAPGQTTSYTIVLSPPGVDRIFLHCTGTNDTFDARDIAPRKLASAQLLHFGYPPLMRCMFQNGGRELGRIMAKARAAGLTTSLDMAFPDPHSDSGRADWQKILQHVLPKVDIFLPSIEELLIMLDRPIYQKAVVRHGHFSPARDVDAALLHRLGDRLLQMGAAIVVIKLGDQGLYLRTTPHITRLKNMGRATPKNISPWINREFIAPCFNVKVAGTTGSGDCTIAGFLAAFVRGEDPETAATTAVAVGACSVEVTDSNSGVPSWRMATIAPRQKMATPSPKTRTARLVVPRQKPHRLRPQRNPLLMHPRLALTQTRLAVAPRATQKELNMPEKKQNFVGFGFGPIQSALFLYEAFATGLFDRLTIAEVDSVLVEAVKQNGGRYTINIAQADGIVPSEVTGVELLNPNTSADRAQLVAAIASANVLATALPSVSFYERGGLSSVAQLLTDGIAARTAQQPAILYAAENHNHAAEILHHVAAKALPPERLQNFQFLNTVIGKMSGVVTDPAEIHRLNLVPLVPGIDRAVLVETFNHILISRVHLPNFHGGIPAFIQKDDLLPFEEAKLYGHNAIHSLLGYLANERGLTTMDQVAAHLAIMQTARTAFLDESGPALCRKYQALHGPRFTPPGFRTNAEHLQTRLTNPWLCDPVARVIRDAPRKLAFDDRLFGAMRLALSQNVVPHSLAKGAAAGIRYLAATQNHPIATRVALSALLANLWQQNPLSEEAIKLVDLTWNGLTI